MFRFKRSTSIQSMSESRAKNDLSVGLLRSIYYIGDIWKRLSENLEFCAGQKKSGNIFITPRCTPGLTPSVVRILPGPKNGSIGRSDKFLNGSWREGDWVGMPALSYFNQKTNRGNNDTWGLNCTMEPFEDRFYPKMGSSNSILTIFLQAVEEGSTGFLRFNRPNWTKIGSKRCYWASAEPD